MTLIASFEVHYTQFLDTEGNLVQELPEIFQDPTRLIPVYRTMMLTRAFDKKAISLQRIGQLGTFASSLGQEAIGAGVGGPCGLKMCSCPPTVTMPLSSRAE